MIRNLVSLGVWRRVFRGQRLVVRKLRVEPYEEIMVLELKNCGFEGCAWRQRGYVVEGFRLVECYAPELE